MRAAVDALDRLIAESVTWQRFHKSRGALGQIECLACDIRIKALRDAVAVIKKLPLDRRER